MTSTQNGGSKTLLLLVLVCLQLGACKNDNIEKVRVITAADNLPMEEGSNILLNYTDSGFVKAKVFAPVMQRFDNEKRNQSVMPKGITAYFYDKNKKITSYIKSKYAVRDDQQRTMTAKYDVIVVNIKGDTLRTESLVWDEKTNLISTNEAVKITTKNDIIYGNGLETNSAFNPYKILKIRGIVSIK